MPPRTEHLEADHAPVTRALRPFSALLTGEAVAVVAEKGAPAATNGGRWRLNSGAEMIVVVCGFNIGRDGYEQPIRCVLDLAAATFAAPRIPSLYMHASWCLIGQWRNPMIDASAIVADHVIYVPKDAAEAAVMPDAVRVKAFMDQDHPWQASVGACPLDGEDGYELVDEEQTVEVNGRTYAGRGDLPLYVMRKPVIFEASVVLWGADSDTGRIAAALQMAARTRSPHPSTQDTAMPTAALKAALARHPKQHHALVAGLVADGKTDADVDAAVHAADIADRDSALAAARTKITALEAEVAELKKRPAVLGEGNPPSSTPGGERGGDAAPKTLVEGLKVVAAEGKHKGYAARAEARRRWPNLT